MFHSRYHIAIVLGLLVSQFSLAQKSSNHANDNWAAFRGDGTSLTSQANVPSIWSDQQNVAWSVAVPGYGQSSPVIWGEQVFVTTMQGDNKETPTIACFKLTDGTEIWKKEFEASQKFSPTKDIATDRKSVV